MSEIFYIENPENVNKCDLENLRLFYLPVIGTTATCLYQYLLDLYDLLVDKTKKLNLNETLQFLGLNFELFKEAKEKLEALGLIKTYLSPNYETLYSLKTPLCANGIAQNSLLSNLIIKKIGIDQYTEIIKAKAKMSFNKNEFYEVSKKYFEVFDVNEINFQKPTFDFEIQDISNAKDHLKSEDFIKYLIKREPSPSQLLMLKKLRKMAFSDKSINLFINFSFNVNNLIVVNYIEKIAKDYARRNIFEADAVDSELGYALCSKTREFSVSELSQQTLDMQGKLLELSGENNWDN
ncbi:Chromosome replication initiation and membrane attachment protein [Metamycoplasma arthritidis]|uniref:Chromosome replication initiation and membrane attachment protein n=1 Tax=Metamycoplasma arthritidis (strain 158L3-1) TaxID=243272 RepID=B3PMZ9_META1|nr:DnaD domain protein [Metamycoplasma arthritidis]ACF07401.1 chromosome replication initiation and membrane attachment protein [Metamycoplasma arthritidis 158L3-1]VEU78923.1 Chromosome replication initiation and membrane attachment protein [Metamycoplasma arthritidis]